MRLGKQIFDAIREGLGIGHCDYVGWRVGAARRPGVRTRPGYLSKQQLSPIFRIALNNACAIIKTLFRVTIAGCPLTMARPFTPPAIDAGLAARAGLRGSHSKTPL
nr:hypothetical protein DO63_5504 [Burkholderia pseudomallei]